MCFAVLHQLILLGHLVRTRDTSAFNVWTMLEAERLVPGLATGLDAQWASLVFGIVLFGAVYAVWAGRRGPWAMHRVLVRRASLRLVRVGGRRRPGRLPLAMGCAAFLCGAALHMVCLAHIERHVARFPSVPDVVHDHLPYVDFGVPGELCFVVFLAAAVVAHLRTQPRAIPAVLAMLGLFYAVRGAFLFLLPLGTPPTAPALEDRFVFYPYASHGYFPGGHAGLMTILSLSIARAGWRRSLFGVALVFTFGTLLARTHYTADALAGCMLGAGIVAWGTQRWAMAGQDARVGTPQWAVNGHAVLVPPPPDAGSSHP